MASMKQREDNPSSVLEDHFRNCRWDDARAFLRTDEGRREVEEGLRSYLPPRTNRIGLTEKARSIVAPALYTAVFHRAPFDIIETTYDMKPEALDESDMNCALGERRNASSSPPRIWHAVERETVLEFLVERCDPRFQLRTSPTGAGANGKRWTPLACAVANERVSPRIVRMMCFRQPDAMEVKCRCPDNYTVLPVDLSVGNREKRNLLLLTSDFYRQHKNAAVGGNKWEKVAIPPVGKEAFELALKDAVKRKQWALVNDLIADAELAGADEEILNKARKKLEREETKREADEWSRKYLGPVMYSWDVVEDLFSAAKRALLK